MKQLILSPTIKKRVISTTVARFFDVPRSIPNECKTPKPYHSIPGPKELPFLGNAWRFLPYVGNLYGYDTYELNKMFYKKYGKIARLGGISDSDLVMIYTPEDIEFLFRNEGLYPIRDSISKTFNYYRENVRSDVFQGYIGFTGLQGKDWQRERSKINPILMHSQTILQYATAMDEAANQFVRKMRHVASLDHQSEMPADFNMLLYAWTLESILLVCLDKHLGCLEINLPKDSEPQKIIQAVLEMFTLFYKIEKVPTVRNIYKTEVWRKFVQSMDVITFTLLKHVDNAIVNIEENKHGDTKEKTILEQLLKLGKQLAITTGIDLIIGGVDTTGKVAGSCMYYLAKTPKAQNTLREELFKLLPNKDTPITKHVLANAPYLKAVVKETTRLAPISAGTIRETVKDMVLHGYQIPKGTRVFASTLYLSHSEEYYSRANEFIPERWLRSTSGEQLSKSTSPFITLPFGFGPRSCLGKRISNLELEIGIAKVIRNFYLEWHYEDVKFKATPFYGIADPLRLRVREVEK